MSDRLVRSLNRSIRLVGLTFLLLILISSDYFGGNDIASKNLRLMFYNVENLFDTLDSPRDDNEFLPDSDRRWNSYKYFRKINNIAKVIVSAGEWEAPDLIGLCEVENKSVLDDLVSKTILRQNEFRTFYSTTMDRRGIGVGIIYNSKLDLISTRSYHPLSAEGDTMLTRSVLFAELGNKHDTLGVLVCHWPSRRGGVAATDPLRESLALLIKKIIEEESARRDAPEKFVIMGDFNCNPDSYIMSDILDIKRASESPEESSLINLANEYAGRSSGTYKFQGRWNYFDQFIINRRLWNNSYGYHYKPGSFSVIDDEHLLVEDISYKGYKPGSSWVGPAYKGGFSDHLPVIIELELSE